MRDDSGEKTLEGSVLGTPGYMSPEQADGRLEEVDQRTDVYGFGAILYHLLTGEAPFAGGNASTVLARVIQEPPTPPRRHVATVAPELEAICLKCLSKKRSDRYQSASELARDMRNYLADEPVTAYPEPWTRRTRALGGPPPDARHGDGGDAAGCDVQSRRHRNLARGCERPGSESPLAC